MITFPFWLIFTIIAFPFRWIGRAIKFLNMEVEDRPILDTFSTLANEEQARASFWDHIDALRVHLLRMLVALAIGVGVSFYFAVPLMEYMAVPVGGLEKLQAIQAQQKAIIASEVNFLRQNRVGLVLADIPPLAAPIARAAGVPGWMMSNFGWDFIYKPWGPDFAPIVSWIEACFGQCDRTKAPPQRHRAEAPISTSAQPVFEAIASGGLVSG